MSAPQRLMVAISAEDGRAISRCDGIDHRGLNCISTLQLEVGARVQLELRDGQRHHLYVLQGVIVISDRLFGGNHELRVEFIDPPAEDIERLLRVAARWGVCQTALPQPRRPVRLTPLEAMRRVEIPRDEQREVARGLLKGEVKLPKPLEAPLNVDLLICFDDFCVPARVVFIHEGSTTLLCEGLTPTLRASLRRLLRPAHGGDEAPAD
ncbi:hypothetical protein KKF91_10005 [Myxococcota bacterium]|nr:hypothetical protein [Myxococcota bacterium]MBU1430872.1 hypothetical protein [Myxococcota bacterium]MBU1899912.1 hypothetical protein [Myxococcota bacterium]